MNNSPWDFLDCLIMWFPPFQVQTSLNVMLSSANQQTNWGGGWCHPPTGFPLDVLLTGGSQISQFLQKKVAPLLDI
ncbi:hypothetical protein GOP47_0018496 [Adiantum capillus-veneris]|uniref:Uncharacterized protein n=1 Tax=Adiantum capillus-veneris TaxID=13818 RepID=A0A9D4Z9P5_ADICA|nr:hypothetical protein GOP47_0018496 [Adiantum capillus-veneris]